MGPSPPPQATPASAAAMKSELNRGDKGSICGIEAEDIAQPVAK
jgi:hypothetical protein